MFSPEGGSKAPEQKINPEILTQWEELKKGPEYFAFVQGAKIGVPQELLDKFVKENIAQKLKDKNFIWLANFVKATGSGTDEEIKKYQELAEKQRQELVMKESPELLEDEKNVEILSSATLADLFNALDELEDEIGFDNLHFWDEIWDNFDSKIGDELLNSMESDVKVMDFFKKHGYSKNDIEVFLPIKFKKTRKKK